MSGYWKTQRLSREQYSIALSELANHLDHTVCLWLPVGSYQALISGDKHDTGDIDILVLADNYDTLHTHLAHYPNRKFGQLYSYKIPLSFGEVQVDIIQSLYNTCWELWYWSLGGDNAQRLRQKAEAMGYGFGPRGLTDAPVNGTVITDDEHTALAMLGETA